MKKQYLEAGRIVTSHGLRGEMKVHPWCDDPHLLTELDALYLENGKAVLEVETARVHKNMVIIKVKGVDTIDDTMRYRSKVLYINRDDVELEPGSYFIQDLLGLSVVDADTGVRYGTLTDVEPTGANDVYTIRDTDGRERLVPAIPQVIVETDVDHQTMRIRPLKGLFED